MAVAPQAVPGAPAPAKAKRNRSPSVAKEAYFIIQIVDENGQPIEFDKKRVRIVSIEREAKNVLDLVEGGAHKHAFYLRGIVPVARQQSRAPASTPAAAAA